MPTSYQPSSLQYFAIEVITENIVNNSHSFLTRLPSLMQREIYHRVMIKNFIKGADSMLTEYYKNKNTNLLLEKILQHGYICCNLFNNAALKDFVNSKNNLTCHQGCQHNIELNINLLLRSLCAYIYAITQTIQCAQSALAQRNTGNAMHDLYKKIKNKMSLTYCRRRSKIKKCKLKLNHLFDGCIESFTSFMQLIYGDAAKYENIINALEEFFDKVNDLQSLLSSGSDAISHQLMCNSVYEHHLMEIIHKYKPSSNAVEVAIEGIEPALDIAR